MSTFVNIVTIIAISFGIAILLFMAYYFYKKRHREIDPFEQMEGEEFEKYCAKLLAVQGFTNIELTPPSHDYGIDILAEYQDITYAIQCKCYSEPVGIRAVQEAYAGRDYYDRMIAAVMTNQEYTRNAKIFAKKLHVLLWDGDYLDKLKYNGIVNGDLRDIANITFYEEVSHESD